MRRIALVFVAACSTGCGLQDHYGKEYVLYDPAAAREARAEAPRAEPVAGDDELARLFELESVLDELNRLIRDGVEPTAALIERRGAVELELAARRRDAGAAYDAARAARAAELARFATRPR